MDGLIPSTRSISMTRICTVLVSFRTSLETLALGIKLGPCSTFTGEITRMYNIYEYRQLLTSIS